MNKIRGKATRIQIDVGEKFKRQMLTAVLQPSDYTDYPSGKECTIEKVQGFISQTGLHKRDGDKLKEAVAAKNSQMPMGKDKPTQNVGILSYVDKFFNWLNGALGDKE